MAVEAAGEITPPHTPGDLGALTQPLARGPVNTGLAPPTSEQAPPPHRRVLSQQREVKKPVPKAVTKPVPMIGGYTKTLGSAGRLGPVCG